ncbi:MAG TPA: glycosyltransferase family 2 protein [Candidatus Saccharimonadales bacterium]|nr:glycosyltransferase family 2 protein [Candidatus Saccharimonadales bacterium]
MKKQISILIPTYNRVHALAVLLTSLAAQNYTNFTVIISDQSDEEITKNQTLVTAIRILGYHGNQVKIYHHLPRFGIAEQRQFLLEKSDSPFSLFLDDDLILEPWVIGTLLSTIERNPCGFVGQAVIGLSFLHDRRPQQQQIEFWDGKIRPESIYPGARKWKRYLLHNAANMLHVQEKLHLTPNSPRPYKVAWIGACVLYDTQKLKEVGGFSFWKDLPREHVGEDVFVQSRLMEKYGGCGILPSGVYHQELPTTIKKREVNAPEYFLAK